MNNISITKTMMTETGHRLNDYDGKCSHFHGHRYQWEVTVTANSLSQNGMIADFSMVKGVMKEVLDPLDHCMILSSSDPVFTVLNRNDSNLVQDVFRGTNGEDGRFMIVSYNPTAENLAFNFGKMMQLKFRELSIDLASIRLHETATSFAEVFFNKR